MANVLVALEPAFGSSALDLERPLAGLGAAPGAGVVEQALAFTFLRAAGFVPAQSVAPDGPSGQFPYRAGHVRGVFRQAGIPLPEGDLEFEMAAQGLMLSISSGVQASGDLSAANVEVYGAREAAPAVQPRLLTALTPLRLGWGWPVWQYNCSRPLSLWFCPQAPVSGGSTRE